MCEHGYREAMTDTVSLDDGTGERMQTISKTIFLARLEREPDLRLILTEGDIQHPMQTILYPR